MAEVAVSSVNPARDAVQPGEDGLGARGHPVQRENPRGRGSLSRRSGWSRRSGRGFSAATFAASSGGS